MSIILRLPVTALLLAALLAADATAQTPTWKAEFVGSYQPTWTLTAPVAVNDAGLVVGNTYLSGYRRAWVGSVGQALTLLPVPAGTVFSEASDVNAAGVIAGGVYLSDGTSRGLLWRPGVSGYELFLLPGDLGGTFPFDARGINDREDVVGKLGIFGGSYVWNAATGVVQLTTAVFPDVPYDVNERREIIGGTYRMDLDTLVLEDLGNPTGTTYNYVYTELSHINDAGEAAGYAVVATSQPPYLPVRFTDGPTWRVYSNFPLVSASVLGLSAHGDTTFQLGIFGQYVNVEGFGSILLQDVLDAASADWDLSGTLVHVLSRGGRVACSGSNDTTGEAGVVLLTPSAFDDLGGAAAGALGTPVLGGYGSLLPGDDTRVRLASAAPNSPGVFVWSSSASPLPLFGGVLYANPPNLFASVQTDSLGRAELSFDWPFVPLGTPFVLQAGVFDAQALGPVSLSNAIQGVTR